MMCEAGKGQKSASKWRCGEVEYPHRVCPPRGIASDLGPVSIARPPLLDTTKYTLHTATPKLVDENLDVNIRVEIRRFAFLLVVPRTGCSKPPLIGMSNLARTHRLTI